MIGKKHKAIIKIIKLIDKVFGIEAPRPNNDWTIFDAIGLEKGNKIIYLDVCAYKKFGYYYSCDIIIDDPDDIRMAYDGQTSDEEELLQIIEKFFEIKRVVT
jgi:hypothetical protein